MPGRVRSLAALQGVSCQPCVALKHKMSLKVETAYDVLLMDNMKRRLSGEAAVAKSVRFADVPKPRKKAQVGDHRDSAQQCFPFCLKTGLVDAWWCCVTAGWLSQTAACLQVQPPRLPGNLAIARPRDNQELATQSAVFGLLAVWTLAQVRMCRLQHVHGFVYCH